MRNIKNYNFIAQLNEKHKKHFKTSTLCIDMKNILVRKINLKNPKEFEQFQHDIFSDPDVVKKYFLINKKIR